MERGRCETGDVGDHATAHRHHHVGPAQTGQGETAAEILDHGHRLGRLAIGHGEHLGRESGVDLDPDPLLGDHGRTPGRGDRSGNHPGQLVTHPLAHQHVVTALAELDRDDPHQNVHPPERVAARTRSTTSPAARSSTSTTASATSA